MTGSFRAEVTAERLHEILDYDAKTGEFRWKASRRRYGGKRAGSITEKGYWRILVDGGHYLAHRLAWLYSHGRWPPAYLDHIDGVKTNNALDNLRESTIQENNRNAVRVGYTYWPELRPSRRYRAAIKVNRKLKVLGFYPTPEAAREAYLQATRELFGEFSVLNRPGDQQAWKSRDGEA